MRRLTSMATVVIVLLSVAPAGAAESVTVDELLADSAAFAGLEITLEGELVGDYGFRHDGSMWTQLNGDSYADAPVAAGGVLTGGNSGVGIRMPETMGRQLDEPGGYRLVGPVVAVTGEWRFHDPGRGGESYLQVTELRLVTSGRAITDPASGWVMALGGVLVLSGLLSAFALQRSRGGRGRGAE